MVGTKSWEEIVKNQKYSETAPKFWLYGRGWDQNDWAVKEYPTKEKLDELFPNRPVYLKELMVTLQLPIKKPWIWLKLQPKLKFWVEILNKKRKINRNFS